jgi:hypothetical protein
LATDASADHCAVGAKNPRSDAIRKPVVGVDASGQEVDFPEHIIRNVIIIGPTPDLRL